MATVSDLLARKGSEVLTVPATVTVLDATQRMNDLQVGSVVVTQDGCVVGIFTERDVLRRIVAQEVPPSKVRVGDVMTREVMCVSPDTPVDQASRIMKDERIRRLPVCDDEG